MKYQNPTGIYHPGKVEEKTEKLEEENNSLERALETLEYSYEDAIRGQ